MLGIVLHKVPSGNHTPGIKSYSDLVTTWADSASTNSCSSFIQRLSIEMYVGG